MELGRVKLYNEKQILSFFDTLVDVRLRENEMFDFKMAFMEVAFKPRVKYKKKKFCREMPLDVFESLMNDLELPYFIEKNGKYYIVRKKRN